MRCIAEGEKGRGKPARLAPFSGVTESSYGGNIHPKMVDMPNIPPSSRRAGGIFKHYGDHVHRILFFR